MNANTRKALITDKAIAFFSIHGFNVSTHELAKYMGITQPLLYHYFGSKQNLIEHVYETVFFSSLFSDIKDILLKRSNISLEDRLVEYLEAYTNIILNNNWTRIFFFAALDNPNINKQYVESLHKDVFTPIIQELYDEYSINTAPTEEDIEIVWSFHSSFFYIGVRSCIYKFERPKNLKKIISTLVEHFLIGYRGILEKRKTDDK